MVHTFTFTFNKHYSSSQSIKLNKTYLQSKLKNTPVITSMNSIKYHILCALVLYKYTDITIVMHQEQNIYQSKCFRDEIIYYTCFNGMIAGSDTVGGGQSI